MTFIDYWFATLALSWILTFLASLIKKDDGILLCIPGILTLLTGVGYGVVTAL